MANSYNTESGNNYSSDTIRKLELRNAQTQAQYVHEEEMAKIANETKIKEAEIKAQAKRHRAELGWLGHIFGSQSGASKYITATICMITLTGMIWLSICTYNCVDGISKIKDIWSIGSPILTLSLGYLFGKN